MPNRQDFEGDITPSYHNEDPASDYRAQKITSGVPRKTYSGGLFDRPTVEDNGVTYYDTDLFHSAVRNWVEDDSNERDSGNMGGPRLLVDQENSTSSLTRLIQTRENESDQLFDVRMDRQTGAMSVNNALSPSGGYFATASARLNKDSPDLEEHPFAIQNATENFREALLDQRGPVVGLQQRGGLYHNYDELSPQILASTKSSIYMPGKDLLNQNVQMRERIAMQDKLQEQVNMRRADFARENGLEMRPALLRSKDDSNHLEDINETFSTYTPTDESGNSLFTDNSKRILMARYEAFHKLSMDGDRMPQVQMAMNLTDATDAPMGYAERHRNRLLGIGLPEGAAEREAGSAQWARSSTYRVPLDHFDQLGLEVGQSFEGGAIPGLQQTEGGNYRRSYIQGIERDEQSGLASITVDRAVDEVNSKFMGIKAFDHNVGPGGVPAGIDLVTRLGSEKDFAMRLTALYASDTATSGFEQGRSGVSVAQEHYVNYLVNNQGFDREGATEVFNQGNVEPAFRPYAFGAAMDYFKGRWFGERYNRTVGQDEVERYLAPGQKFADFQFDDAGNVTNHPAMLRHEVSNPSEMASVFGSRLVNDLTEAGSGQGLEKLRVSRRTEDGRYIVEARDVTLDSMSIMRNRAEFPSSSHVFGQDELNTMASSNPALYQNLQDLDRRGVLKNYAREIVQAAQVNRGVDVNLGYGTPGGVIDGLNMRDTSGNRITFGGVREQVRAASPGYMDENEIAKRSLWELDRQTNGARIQIGDTLYGSAGAMATNFQLDDQGQSVNTLGTQFANALDLQERFAGELDNPNVAAEVANATLRLNEAQNELSEQPAIRKAAGGIVSDVLGGPQVSNSGLRFNEIAYNRSDYLSSLSGLADDERTQRMADFDSGTAASSFTMYPHSDSSNAFLNLRAVDADRVREREGMGDFYVRPGGNVVHPAVNQALNKDNDADFGMGIPFRGENTPTAHSEAEILERVRRSTGGEDVNALKVANRQVLGLFAGAVAHTVSPDGTVNSRYNAEVHGAALRNSQERKIMMGPNYNAGQREAMIFKREMLEQTSLSPQAKESLVQAAGKSASSPYQVELDMEGESDVATRFLLKARSNLAQPTLGVNGDRSLAGQASFFDVDNPEGGTNIPGFENPLRMTELSGPQNFATFMISKMATQFMGRENYLERDPNHPDSPTNTPGLVRDVAQNLLPVGVANDEGRIDAMSIFLGRIHAGYGQLSEEDQLNFRFNNDQLDEFLDLAAPESGKKGAQDYFFGNSHLAAEDRAMAPAVWNAYTARRAAYKKTYYGGQNEKGEDDAFSKPPKGDWELGSETDDHGVERKWFRRNITDEGTIGDPQSFQGRGGEEGNRMAVLRGAYHDVAANEGSVETQVADNRIVAANIAHATAHTSHMANEGILGRPEAALDTLDAANGALAVFNMNSNKPASAPDRLRRVFDPATGRMTDDTPYGSAPDTADYSAYDNKDSAMDLLAETSRLPGDHPDRLAAVALFAEAADNAIGAAERPEAGGGGGRGGDDSITMAAPEPEEPGRPRPGSSGGQTVHNQNYTTVTQYRAQPPTIPEVEALRGQLSFLDSFQGMDDPAGLTHAQQGSLLGAVTSVQKLMARGESSIHNNQKDPGTRYYDDVMNGGEGTLKHDLLTTMDDLQPLLAAISPIYEETRLNTQYGKGVGVVGQLNEAERFVHATGSHIEGLLSTLGNADASKDERGVARFQLERFQQMVNLGISEGAPTTPAQESELDRIGQAVLRATNEGVGNVSPAVVERRQQRSAERDAARQQRVDAHDEEYFQKRMDSYRENEGEIGAAEDILNGLRPEELTEVISAAGSGDKDALKRVKAIQKQVNTINQFRDIGTELPDHITPFETALGSAIQAGDYAAATREPEQKPTPAFVEGRATEMQTAVAGAAQNYLNNNIDKVPDLLERLNKAIAGTGEVSEEATKKAQNFVRAYKDCADELDEAIKLKQNNGVLNARQQALMGDDNPEQANARLTKQREAAADLSSAIYSLSVDDEEDTSLRGRLKGAAGNLYNRAIRGQGIFHAKLALGALVNPAVEAARGYLDDQASQGQLLYQSGQVNFDDLMAGDYGTARTREVRAAQGQLAFGRQVYNAYSPLVNAAVGPEAANGPLGALAAIGLPALGLGIAATSLTGSPAVGGITALATAGVGAFGYVDSARQDRYNIGKVQQGQNGFDNFSGWIGDANNKLVASLAQGLFGIPYDQGLNQTASGNADEYARISDEYASGQIDAEEMRRQALKIGANPADIANVAMTNMKTEMGKFGLTPEQAEQALTPWEIFSPGQQPTTDQKNRLARSQVAGFDLYNATMGGLEVSGITPGSPQAANIMESALDTANQQPNQATYGLVLSTLQQKNIETSALQRRAAQNNNGVGPVLTYDILQQQAAGLQAGTINPDVQESQNLLAGYAATTQLSNPRYYDLAGKNALQAGGSADYAYNRGLFQQGDQIIRNVEQNEAAFTQAQAYGASDKTLAAFDKLNLITDPAQQYLAQQITGGSRFALSHAIQNGQAPNLYGLNTINTRTGQGIYDTGGFDGQDYRHLADNDPYDQFRIDQTEFMKDGTRGLRNAQRVEGYAFEDFNRIMGQRQQTMSYQMQTGQALAGQATFDRQGFMTNSGDQSVLQGLFAQYNLPGYQPTLSQYEIEDASTKLSREQQQYSQWQQGQGLVLNRAGFALSGQQFNENFGFQQQQFQFQTSYQRSQMNVSREYQVTQQGWQREDLSYSRDQLEINNAWEMQDYDRNIRYARGRDKRDLMRQQERATIQYSMQMGQQDRQEGRQETQAGWSAQIFDKEKGYFEQNVAFQQQKMALQQKQFQEDRQLQEQRLRLSEQSHQKEMNWLAQQFNLEDQQRTLTRQATEAQRAIQQDVNTRTNEYVNRTRALGDAVQFADQRTSEWNAKISVMAVNGTLAAVATAAFTAALNNVPAAAQHAAQAAATINHNSGGNTGIGAAIVGTPGAVGGGSAMVPLPPASPNGTPGAIRGTVWPQIGYHDRGGMAGSQGLSQSIGMTQWASQQFVQSLGQIASFDGGGPTGSAPLNQPVGVVHGGEYVVPANGSLVLRDDDLNTLMRKVVELLQRADQYLSEIASHPTTFAPILNGLQSEDSIPLTQQIRARR